MRRLWPDPAEVDDVEVLVAGETRPAPPTRPWLLVNMVSSLDGAIAVEGRSGALSGPADRAAFMALRNVADVVMAGAGTVRREGYGPARPTDAARSTRSARGQAEAPRIAVVTRSLDLDLTTPLFTESEAPPLVITCASAPRTRQEAVARVAELIVTGQDSVDLTEALARLRQRGATIVTCEGGPTLNHDLVAEDLIDEWDLTLSPMLVGGGSERAICVPNARAPLAMRLDRVLEGDSLLLTRWLRDR